MSWSSTSLAEATELLTDGTHYTPPDIGDGIPFLTVKDVSDDGLDFEGCSKIAPDEYELARRQNSAPRLGDVLFSKDGTVGKVHLVREDRPFAVLSSLAILRPSKHVDGRYLAHFLRTSATIDAAAKKKTGSAIRRIVLRDLATLEIPLPPIGEQLRIAAILDKADALRRKRKRAINLLAEFSNSFVDLNSKSNADRKAYNLGECLEFMTTGGRNWSKFYADKGSRFIRSFDVQMNGISNDDVTYVDAPDNAEARRTRTRVGDVLLTVTGSRIGRVAALPNEMNGSFVSQHVAILRPKGDKLRPKFLSYFLSSEGGQRQIEKWQYGQTKPGLNFAQIQAFEIPGIDLLQQDRIVNGLQSIEATAQIEETQLRKSNSLFSSLQHRAFSGQL